MKSNAQQYGEAKFSMSMYDLNDHVWSRESSATLIFKYLVESSYQSDNSRDRLIKKTHFAINISSEKVRPFNGAVTSIALYASKGEVNSCNRILPELS